MNVVLVEANAVARPGIEGLLRSLGARSVACFGDPEIAFRFLLGRLHEVQAVVVDEDDPEAPGLLRRVRALPARIAVVAYSGRRLAAAAERDGAPGPEALAAAVAWMEPGARGVRRARE